jgi:hypothetical protein
MNQQHSQHPLHLAVEDLKTLPTIDINGKSYTQVASRIVIFRKYFPEYSVITNILHDDEYRVVVQTKITSPNGIIIATGLAEEFRRDNNPINTTSALENAETSSIGRALACLSLGGSEYASSNEVENAISQQQNNNPKTNNQNYQNQNTYQKQYQHSQDFSVLINAGLKIIDTGDVLTIAGEGIFEKKSIIKNAGFHWSGQNRVWYMKKSEVA